MPWLPRPMRGVALVISAAAGTATGTTATEVARFKAGGGSGEDKTEGDGGGSEVNFCMEGMGSGGKGERVSVTGEDLDFR